MSCQKSEIFIASHRAREQAGLIEKIEIRRSSFLAALTSTLHKKRLVDYAADCIAFHGTAVALCRNSRSETTVRAPSIVVTNPLRQEPTEMLLVQGDHEIQTLASYGPDQSFTKCIPLRRLRRSFQDLHTETLASS